MAAWRWSNLELSLPIQAHLSEKSSRQTLVSPTPARFSSYQNSTQAEALPDVVQKYRQAPPKGLRQRFVDEFRKNYCPRTSPALVLPTAPTDEEKYSYVDMKRVFLVSCITAALLTVVVGSWMFARKAPVFAWWIVIVLVIDFPLFASVVLILLGRPFDLAAHRKLLNVFPLNDEHNAPTVDVYLPVCNEPLELLENTWDYVARLQYPASKMSVFVLDDGAKEAVKIMAHRYGYNYICRPNRPELKKAGNLRYAFARTSGELFTIFDADFCPRPDFLRETVPYLLEDERRAILQTTQFFRSSADQTWVEQGAGTIQEHMFRIMLPCRDRWGAAICVGSNAVYRRTALAPLGGTAAVSSSEDMYTGFYVTAQGWILKYIPLNLACGVCPDTPRAFFAQQLRWCSSMALLLDRDFWTAKLSVAQKLCYLLSFSINVATALPVFLIPLPGPLLLWARPDLFRFYNLFFAFPSLFLGLVALRIWARGRYTLSVQYVHVIIIYAYLQAIWDIFFLSGSKPDWVPSASVKGGSRGGKNRRYRNMRVLAIVWTGLNNGVLIVAAAYRVVVTGVEWFQVVPALVLNALALLFVHRFLLFRHPG
ncbi:MAG: hypothetical protein Q9223_003314 [Gallowayella weberi]